MKYFICAEVEFEEKSKDISLFSKVKPKSILIEDYEQRTLNRTLFLVRCEALFVGRFE
jgi:hypothetical protein